VYNAAGDAKVITGKQLKKVTATSSATNDYEIKTQSLGFYVSTVDNLKRVSIIAVESNAKMPSAGNDAKTYGLIVSDAVKADDNYIEYDIWTGTEKVTVQEKKVSKLSARKQFAVVKYSAITDGVIKDVEDTTLTADPGSAWVAGTLYLANVISTSDSKLWTANSAAAGDLDSDTVYMYYDSSTTDADSIGKLSGELTVGDKVTVSGGVDKYVANIQYVIDSDGDVVFVLVDTKNLVQDAVAQNVTGYKLSRTTTPSDTGNLENVSISAATTVIGKAMTLKFTVKGSGAAQQITLTNAVLSDGTNVISTKDLAAGTYEYTIYATADAYTYALANDT
jgi:tRNA-binding EMAP/Myf-like protein